MNSYIKFNTICLILILLFLSSSYSIFAQKKKPQNVPPKSDKPKISKVEITSKSKFTNEEIKLDLTSLPPYFYGNDPMLIYEALEAREKSKEKDEFETTEQYKLRIERENQKPILDSLKLNSKFAFVNFNETISQITNLYDADNQIMSYKFEPIISKNLEVKISRNSPKLNCFSLDWIIVNNYQYVGSNAYGNKATVNKVVFDVPSLIVENWDSDYVSQIDVKLPIDMAKIAKSKGLVLFIGEIVSPYHSVGYDSIEPTIDKPRDTLWVYNYLYFRLDEIWIFNRETGEIYSKTNIIEKRQRKIK